VTPKELQRNAKLWLTPAAAIVMLVVGVILAVGRDGNDASASQQTSVVSTTSMPPSTVPESTTTAPPVTTTLPPETTTTLPAETTTTTIVYNHDNPRPLPEKSGKGRRVVYQNSLNWVWIVDENEQVVLSVPVSGREGVPKPRKYAVMSKSEFSQSIFYPEIKMKWSVRFAISPNGKNTISFHSIPVCAWTGGHCNTVGPMQTPEQLGTFQSGGCVRMLEADVKFLYDFVEVGTPVVVLP
jgi:lipoprotein-anchoring transpeptidase ErfK/SrfK